MRALWRRNDAWYRATPEERQHNRLRRSIWWGVTSNTLDKATALLPALAERAPAGAGHRFRGDLSELRAHASTPLPRTTCTGPRCRAYNMMTADMFAPFAATVCAGRDHSRPHAGRGASRSWNTRSGSCGFKAIMLRGNQERPIPGAAEGIDPQKAAWYIDTIALDSPYDYEPFWQRCVELGVAVTQHSGSTPLVGSRLDQQLHLQPRRPLRRIEPRVRARAFSWAASRGAIPSLNFGFMEGGVSWACQMYFDLIEHWEKRQRAELQYPDTTDLARAAAADRPLRRSKLKASADAIMGNLDAFRPECSIEELSQARARRRTISKRRESTRKRMSAAVFTENFYFGCEADDRATMWAFDPRMGVRLRPVFSSDFTHFDVPDFEDVIPEVFEMVEKGFVTEQDFREFTFTNAARLHTRNNPDFFKGTVVEQAVADELGLKTPLAAAQA